MKCKMQNYIRNISYWCGRKDYKEIQYIFKWLSVSVKIIDGFDFIFMLFFILSQLSIMSLFMVKEKIFFAPSVRSTKRIWRDMRVEKIKNSVRSVSMFYSSLYIQRQEFAKCMVNIHLKNGWLGNKYENCSALRKCRWNYVWPIILSLID